MSSDMVGVLKKIALEAVDANKPMEVFFGTVTGVSPLKIQIDQKITLDENLLILTDNVRDIERDITVAMTTDMTEIEGLYHNHSYSGTTTEDNYTNNVLDINYTHSHQYSGNTSFYGTTEEISHNHTVSGKKKIILHNGLKPGEMVLLLRCNCGQKYVVMDRITDYSAKGEWLNDT